MFGVDNNQSGQDTHAIPVSPVPHSSLPADTQPQSSKLTQDNLLALKQKALSSLGPLVDQLQQPPEEKFKTTMMLIQASDNQAMLEQAYQTALQINDDRARAQALIDVVNEVNYFTQKNEENTAQ